MQLSGRQTKAGTSGDPAHAEMLGPLTRRGPRPLLLHLMLSWMNSSTSVDALADWSSFWKNAASLGPNATGARHESSAFPEGGAGGATAFQTVLADTMRQDRALIAGIAAYRRHPQQRVDNSPPAIWREGGACLRDYAPNAPGRPVLFVPSLINRSYILDLSPSNSLLRFLADNGVRPLLLDWGWPGSVERKYTLTDYIAGPLERAMASLGSTAVLVGYCMGGLLASAAAQRRPDLVHALALLATPWDFRIEDAQQADLIARLIPLLRPLLDLSGTLPTDVLQSLFALVDPNAVADKFRRFGRLDQACARARRFVEIEDWANDGVPLAAPVARECFIEWYGCNAPVRGDWRVAGMPVRPQSLAVPSFVAIPGRDRIVSPDSAWPMARLLLDATVVQPKAGHVSMVVGPGAEVALWRPLLNWLRTL